jgi:hypothetical protein
MKQQAAQTRNASQARTRACAAMPAVLMKSEPPFCVALLFEG